MQPSVLRKTAAIIIALGFPVALVVLRPSPGVLASVAKAVGYSGLLLAALVIVSGVREAPPAREPRWLFALQAAALAMGSVYLLMRSSGSAPGLLGAVAVGLIGASAVAGLVRRFSRPGRADR